MKAVDCRGASMRYGLVLAMVGVVFAVGYAVGPNIYDKVSPKDQVRVTATDPKRLEPLLPTAKVPLSPSLGAPSNRPTTFETSPSPPKVLGPTFASNFPKQDRPISPVSGAKRTLSDSGKKKQIFPDQQTSNAVPSRPSTSLVNHAKSKPLLQRDASKDKAAKPKKPKEVWHAQRTQGRPVSALQGEITSGATCHNGGYCRRDPKDRDVLLAGVVLSFERSPWRSVQVKSFRGEVHQGNYWDLTPAVYLQ